MLGLLRVGGGGSAVLCIFLIGCRLSLTVAVIVAKIPRQSRRRRRGTAQMVPRVRQSALPEGVGPLVVPGGGPALGLLLLVGGLVIVVVQPLGRGAAAGGGGRGRRIIVRRGGGGGGGGGGRAGGGIGIRLHLGWGK